MASKIKTIYQAFEDHFFLKHRIIETSVFQSSQRSTPSQIMRQRYSKKYLFLTQFPSHA